MVDKASAARRILSISYDAVLLRTREMILARAGYAVSSVSNLGDALQQCATDHFDAVIVGHTLQTKDKRAIVAALKDNCSAPVLVLLRAGEARIPGADSCVVAADGPAVMLDALRQLLSADGG